MHGSYRRFVIGLSAGLILLAACGDDGGDTSGGDGGGGQCNVGGEGGAGGDCGGPGATSSGNGGHAGDGGHTGDGGTGGEGGVGGGSSSCGPLNGSCSAPPNTPNGDPSCQDWLGFDASMNGQFESECTGDGNTWSTNSCTEVGTWNFACQNELAGGFCTTSYINYADASKIAQASSTCTASGGVVIIP